MENNIDKNQWIDDVLDSTKGMRRAQPAPGLYDRVNSRISNYRGGRTIVLPVKQWMAAAILLVLLNAGAVVYFTAKNHQSMNRGISNPFAAAMQAESTYNY